jgi:hypothetical protein
MTIGAYLSLIRAVDVDVVWIVAVPTELKTAITSTDKAAIPDSCRFHSSQVATSLPSKTPLQVVYFTTESNKSADIIIIRFHTIHSVQTWHGSED